MEITRRSIKSKSDWKSIKEAFDYKKGELMIRKFCDICGREEDLRESFVKRQVYVQCTPDGKGHMRREMDLCDSCNLELNNAGMPAKIVAEVDVLKQMKQSIK